jgi:hypothetical protein
MIKDFRNKLKDSKPKANKFKPKPHFDSEDELSNIYHCNEEEQPSNMSFDSDGSREQDYVKLLRQPRPVPIFKLKRFQSHKSHTVNLFKSMCLNAQMPGPAGGLVKEGEIYN